MNNKATAVIASFGLVLCLGLTACGSSDTSSDSAAAEKVELTGDQIIDAALAASPIDEDSAFDIKVSAVENGVAVVTFGSPYGDFSYTIDAYTGEVVDKTEPTEALEEAAQNPLDKDPITLATTACLDAYNANGNESNVHVESRTDDGVQKVRVQFDLEGKHYDLDYDVATGKITEYSSDVEAAADEKEDADAKAAAEKKAMEAAAKATENGTKTLSDDEAMDMALDACWDIYVVNGDAQDIVMEAYTEDGAQKVNVQFTLDGDFYDLVYDVATGVITKK